MHPSSREAMTRFRETLPDKGRVLDVGALDINGSYRYLFNSWDYVGLDIVDGPNVDYTPREPYAWASLKDGSFDVVISGQTFEHIEDPEKTMAEIERVLKAGGTACIIGPTTGGSHNEPWFRNLSAAYMKKLAKDAGLMVRSCTVNESTIWKDCVLIASKRRKADGKS